MFTIFHKAHQLGLSDAKRVGTHQLFLANWILEPHGGRRRDPHRAAIDTDVVLVFA
jgi:hypothetical protein